MQIAKCKLQIEGPKTSVDGLGFRLARLGSIFLNLQFAICNLQFAILVSTFVAGSSSIALGADLEAPLVGRKEPFCGAVGSGRFKVSTAANPASLQAGDPMLLTIRIEAVGVWMKAPKRPGLVNKPEYRKFREKFHVDNGQERPSPAEGKWEFDFRLRPKSEQVKEIPALAIVYFRPGFTPPEKGYMMTTAPAIPVQVTSRAKVQLSEIRGQSTPSVVPDQLYEIITGPSVLRNDDAVVFPNAWLLCFLALAPPALSVGWYLAWKRRNPTQARLSRLRKSRAARRALLALENGVNGKAGKACSEASESKDEACGVAQVLASYLQERLDLSAVHATPADIASHLTNKGCSTDLADRTAELFRACDTVRFSPPRAQGVSLPALRAEAAELVLALESQP